MEQIDWRRVIEAIRRGRCILVAGPQVAVHPSQPDQGPLSNSLARKIAERDLVEDEGLCDPESLPHVAQLFCNSYNRSRMDLEFEVQDFYGSFQGKTTSLHRDLAQLPFKLCVNTTPDGFLYNAFTATSKEPKNDYYNFRRLRDSALAEPTERSPLVFDLCGSTREPESLVLSENELLEFLVKAVTRDPPLQPLISRHFADPDNSFLFLGFGFDQWHVRILLHILQVHGHKQPSLVLEGPKFFADPAQRKTTVFFERECHFVFRELSFGEFGSELRTRFEEQRSQQPASPIELPENAPTVFLCYRSEDRDKVVEVERSLHSLGINTWRDQQNLRGGDEWHRVINDVLRKQVDYVLVLLTRKMVDSVRNYCNREIEIALDTQKEFGEFAFVIPAKLEPCDGLDSLSHLQTADLTVVDGIAKLADTIKHDWQKREAVKDA